MKHVFVFCRYGGSVLNFRLWYNKQHGLLAVSSREIYCIVVQTILPLVIKLHLHDPSYFLQKIRGFQDYFSASV